MYDSDACLHQANLIDKILVKVKRLREHLDMSIIIRLQNLSWSADSSDIRRYFAGLSIPEGGVHIVGGEKGDAFIAFSTDEDARLAMAKDGGKIQEVQIRLLLSSRTEMMRVIEKARQQNLALQTQPQYLPIQQPIIPVQQPVMSIQQPVMSVQQPIMSIQHPIISAQQSVMPIQQPARSVLGVENDRKRGRSPSPSLHRNRDKSTSRERRRSSDSRRSSKRERSRSPVLRGSRDADRQSSTDRYKREDHHYDDDSHYDRQREKDNGAMSHQFRGVPNEEYHMTANNRDYYESSTPSYGYEVSQISGKDLPGSFYIPHLNEKTNVPGVSNSRMASSNQYQPLYSTMKYDQMEESALPPDMEHARERRGHNRFAAEYSTSQQQSFFDDSTQNQKTGMTDTGRDSSFNDKRPTSQNFRPHPRNSTWPQQDERKSGNSQWPGKRPGLLEPPISKKGDPIQPGPNNPELPAPGRSSDKNQFGPNDQYAQKASLLSLPRNDTSSRNDERIRREPASQGDSQFLAPPMAVEIRGLPPDVKVPEILDLFRDIPIPPANICITVNNQKADKAYIHFSSSSECKEVLSRQPFYIRNYSCQVVACSVQAFEAAISLPSSIKSRPKPKPREEDLCLQLKGLPFSCSEKDVEQFFNGLKLVDMFIERSSDGRSSGIGYVQLSSQNDFRVALTLNGKMIGHRYINISVASKEFFTVARGPDYPPQRSKSPPLASGPSGNYSSSRRRPNDIPPSNLGNGPPPPTHLRPTNFSISLRGLPDRVTNDDIAEFFHDVNIGIRAYHIMLNPDKSTNGDAFIEVPNKRDADAALSKNGKVMRGKRVSVTPIPYQKMQEILRPPDVPSPPLPVPGALLRTPPNAERPRRPLIPQAPGEGQFEDGPLPDHPPNERLPFDCPPNDQSSYDHLCDDRMFPRGDRPRPDFARSNRPRPGFPRFERPRMDGPYRGSRPLMERPVRPPHGRMRAPFSNRPPFNGPPIQECGAANFGAPGCVVSINNLHYRASLEDILDFFKDYELTKDSVIRRINEKNQPTGEARVAFQTPREAQRAAKELNHKTIMGRSLSLSLL
ncbi:hypothetical protein TNCT_488911 [Trichonephila clavata]|uniref:RRM domain-containing protein n=1 Tax=Trichonephila clavata TaxID=2740835 RepID=A0A8X6HKC6_TRICU|nr:hypothetical protein TNCT_488911 [Trichonephila clavata]